MPESPIQQLLAHPYRHWIVGGTAFVLTLTLGLSAFDELSVIREETAQVQIQIEEASRSVANLPTLEARLQEALLARDSQATAVSQETARHLQEEVVRLIQSHECRLLKVKLSETHDTPWDGISDPLTTVRTTTNIAKDSDQPFVLVTTKLNISAEGSLTRLDKLIGDLKTLHPLALPTQMSLRQDDYNGFLMLSVELTLLDLKPTEKK